MKTHNSIVYIVLFVFVMSSLSYSCKNNNDDDDTFGVIANFTITPSTGTTATDFTFNASNTTTQGEWETITYEWHFGDGEQIINGNEQETHKYALEGNYEIYLLVKIYKPNNTGSAGDDITKTLTVTGDW